MSIVGRVTNNYLRLIFDPRYMENVTRSLKVSKHAAKKAAANGLTGQGFYSNIGKNMKDAFTYAERQSKVAKMSIWQTMKKQATSLIPDISKTWKNTSGFFGKLKGVAKQFGKRMPLIGAVMTVAFELPNIISAFKDKGFIGGVAETAKSGARLGGFMAGMAIGQALIPIPILGGIIGGMAGDWLVSKVVGKSHSEQKAEALAEAEQNTQQRLMDQINIDPFTGQPISQNQAISQATMSPQQLEYMRQQLYGGMNNFNDDFMMNATGMNRMNSPQIGLSPQSYMTPNQLYKLNQTPQINYQA